MPSIPAVKALRTLVVIARQPGTVEEPEPVLALYRRPLLSTRFRAVRTFEIAVGDIGHKTPAGVFVITRKSNHPDWTAPGSPWVPEEIRGKVFVAGDPANPIVGAFLDIWDGVGVHGTRDLASLGTAASHGCIRMREDDVLELYRRTPVGTPVVVV